MTMELTGWMPVSEKAETRGFEVHGRFEDRDGGSLVEVRLRPTEAGSRLYDATEYDGAALRCWMAYGGTPESLDLHADLSEDGEATYRALRRNT